MLAIAWFFFLAVASLFGFERQSEQRERQEMFAFFQAHQTAFCRKEHIPSAYCSKVFEGSAAYQAAIGSWVEIQRVRDKERQDKASFVEFPDLFRDPFVRR